ncbi:hypothetical protein SAMN05216359_1295 [Roseateles sp. YR242]|uniref:hypothetical protein n=1 Tax=Roseateles sp. YR242 TaxID=1855305 RepID=UPI0008C2981F|nr:hypothetical protein [Roseateles sp. YR242]SEL93628.1 hypothetical protein SAMN05216359_1295 [Roseateles sp. YR242]
MLSEFTKWLLDLLRQFFTDLWQFVTDLVLTVLEGILDAVATLLAGIQVPDFLSAGLQSVFSGLDPGVLWLVSEMGVMAALAVVGTGFTVRIVRKLVTLFQW